MELHDENTLIFWKNFEFFLANQDPTPGSFFSPWNSLQHSLCDHSLISYQSSGILKLLILKIQKKFWKTILIDWKLRHIFVIMRQRLKKVLNLWRKPIFQFFSILTLKIDKTTYSCAMNPDESIFLIRFEEKKIFEFLVCARGWGQKFFTSGAYEKKIFFFERCKNRDIHQSFRLDEAIRMVYFSRAESRWEKNFGPPAWANLIKFKSKYNIFH